MVAAIPLGLERDFDPSVEITEGWHQELSAITTGYLEAIPTKERNHNRERENQD